MSDAGDENSVSLRTSSLEGLAPQFYGKHSNPHLVTVKSPQFKHPGETSNLASDHRGLLMKMVNYLAGFSLSPLLVF